MTSNDITMKNAEIKTVGSSSDLNLTGTEEPRMSFMTRSRNIVVAGTNNLIEPVYSNDAIETKTANIAVDSDIAVTAEPRMSSEGKSNAVVSSSIDAPDLPDFNLKSQKIKV